MPTLDTGVFLFMTIGAFGFTLLSFRAVSMFAGFLHLMGLALFLGLAVFLASGMEVATITNDLQYNGTGHLIVNSTSTEVFITGGESTNWLWYIFLGFSVFNLILLVRDYAGAGNR